MTEKHNPFEKGIRKAYKDHQQTVFDRNKELVDRTHDKMQREIAGEGCGCASCLRDSVERYNDAIGKVDEETAWLNGHEPMDVVFDEGVIRVIPSWDNYE